MDRERTDLLARTGRTLAARWTHPVNWTMRGAGLACLGLALLLRSGLLVHTGVILVCVSALNTHLAPPKWTLVIRIQTVERNWLNAPWTRTKRMQALWLVLIGAATLAVLASGSLALLALAVGGVGLFLAHRNTQAKLRDIRRDEALDKLLKPPNGREDGES